MIPEPIEPEKTERIPLPDHVPVEVMVEMVRGRRPQLTEEQPCQSRSRNT